MSFRYIWEKNSFKYELKEENSNCITDTQGAISVGDCMEFDETTGKLTVYTSDNILASTLFYFLFPNNIVHTFSRSGACSTITSKPVKVSLISTISSNSESKYPKDGISGSYYYVYKGCDIYDPKSLSFLSISQKNNSQINSMLYNGFQIFSVRIQQSENILFGGTISYLVDSQYNDETWNTVYSSTKSTNIPFMVSNDIHDIKIRVLTSDNMGYTSTNYVESDKVSLNPIKSNNICTSQNPNSIFRNPLFYLNIFVTLK